MRSTRRRCRRASRTTSRPSGHTAGPSRPRQGRTALRTQGDPDPGAPDDRRRHPGTRSALRGRRRASRPSRCTGPHRRNAISARMLRELGAALARADDDAGRPVRAPHRCRQGLLLGTRPEGRDGRYGYRCRAGVGSRGGCVRCRRSPHDGAPGDEHAGARRHQRRRGRLRARSRARLRHAARQHVHPVAARVRQAGRGAGERRHVVPAATRRLVTRVPHRDARPRPGRVGSARVRIARRRRGRTTTSSRPRVHGPARSPRMRRSRSRR